MPAENPNYYDWMASGYTPDDIREAYPDQYLPYLDFWIEVMNGNAGSPYYTGNQTTNGWSAVANAYPHVYPSYQSTTPGYSGHQYPGYNGVGSLANGYTGSVYTGMPAQGQGNNGVPQPAAQQQYATTQHPFTNAQWASLTQAPWSNPHGVTVDGHTYTNKYNYIGPTTTGLTDPNAGWGQMNRYGQPLGTLGPIGNKANMAHKRSALQRGVQSTTGPIDPSWVVVDNHNHGQGTGVTGNPGPTNGGGGYTGNTYNDLINWRI